MNDVQSPCVKRTATVFLTFLVATSAAQQKDEYHYIRTERLKFNLTEVYVSSSRTF